MGAEALQPAELPVERCSAGPGLGPISHTTVLPSVLSAWRRGSTQRQSKAPCPFSRSGRLWACVLGFAVSKPLRRGTLLSLGNASDVCVPQQGAGQLSCSVIAEKLERPSLNSATEAAFDSLASGAQLGSASQPRR